MILGLPSLSHFTFLYRCVISLYRLYSCSPRHKNGSNITRLEMLDHLLLLQFKEHLTDNKTFLFHRKGVDDY